MFDHLLFNNEGTTAIHSNISHEHPSGEQIKNSARQGAKEAGNWVAGTVDVQLKN